MLLHPGNEIAALFKRLVVFELGRSRTWAPAAELKERMLNKYFPNGRDKGHASPISFSGNVNRREFA